MGLFFVHDVSVAAAITIGFTAWVDIKSISGTDREADHGEEAEGESEEIQEGKTRCPGAQEEGDEEGDAGEEGNHREETGDKTRARSDSSDAADGKFRRQDRRSIDTAAGSNAIAQH